MPAVHEEPATRETLRSGSGCFSAGVQLLTRGRVEASFVLGLDLRVERHRPDRASSELLDVVEPRCSGFHSGIGSRAAAPLLSSLGSVPGGTSRARCDIVQTLTIVAAGQRTTETST